MNAIQEIREQWINSNHNPDMIVAWNKFAVPLGAMAPDEALPLWNAFKAGWDARLKHDLTVTSYSDNLRHE